MSGILKWHYVKSLTYILCYSIQIQQGIGAVNDEGQYTC